MCICVDFEIVHVAFFDALILVVSNRHWFRMHLTRQIKHNRASVGGGSRVVSGMPVEGNFIPASYTCTPLHQLSPCFAPHTVLSTDACSKWTHTPIKGMEGVSPTASSVSFHRRTSFLFFLYRADRALHMVADK